MKLKCMWLDEVSQRRAVNRSWLSWVTAKDERFVYLKLRSNIDNIVGDIYLKWICLTILKVSRLKDNSIFTSFTVQLTIFIWWIDD